MAFNPFVSFRKNQKFWMAAILLLCMVTFVLCTGLNQGDLGDWLLRQFSPRRGTAMANLDGRVIYSEELNALRMQRNLANEFMRKSIDVVLFNIDQIKKGDNTRLDDEKRRVIMTRLSAVEGELKRRLLKPFYFDGGVKLEELLDFMIWQKQADRLGIDLVAESVQDMFTWEIFAVVPQVGSLFRDIDSRLVQRGLRSAHYGVTDAVIMKAVGDEFRVRIAKLAGYSSQPDTFLYRSGKENQFFKLKGVEEVRAALTPAQMWDFYGKNRSLYDIALVPVRVDNKVFLDKIPEPTAKELEAFFDEHKSKPFNPASPTPGFEIPKQVKIEWIMADPNSAFYQVPARAAVAMELYPPAFWSPVFPYLAALGRYGAAPSVEEAVLDRLYDSAKAEFKKDELAKQAPEIFAMINKDKDTPRDKKPPKNYQAPPLTENIAPALLSYLDKPAPAAIASAIGLGARLGVPIPDARLDVPFALSASYRSHAFPLHRDELERLAAIANRPRLRLAANAIALGATGPLPPALLWGRADEMEQFLPLAAVAQDFKGIVENTLARNWVKNNMVAVRERLERGNLAGLERTIKPEIRRLIRKYGLENGATEGFLNRYDTAKAPELAPLKQAFDKYIFEINTIEGRQGKPNMLKEDDFYKLFFDGEAFSSSGARYAVHPWPPDLEAKGPEFLGPRADAAAAAARKIVLYDVAEKPILFWKTDDLPSKIPDTVNQVRERAVEAWKLEKAREKLALARAMEIAKALQNIGGGDYGQVVDAEAKKLGTQRIKLDGLAALYPDDDPKALGKYHDYPLPKGAFDYPNEDMVKQLLVLTNLQEPLQNKYAPLDEANKKLFEVTKKMKGEGAGKQVQILTNQPHTVFYVAVVVHAPGPDLGDFARALQKSQPGPFGNPGDTFLTLAQEEAAKDYTQALLVQLRGELKFELKADEQERKSFDSSQN